MPNKIIPKEHLACLPDIESPPKKVLCPSEKHLMIIPVFNGYPNQDYAGHHVTISAIWARQSWLAHTDVSDYDIAIKFYVEENVADSVMPIFDRNFVEEDDIIWFDNGSVVEGVLFDEEGNTISRGIKQCLPYIDRRFINYDWLFVLDSDVFAISRDGAKIPFFERFLDNSPDNQIGACFWGMSYDTPHTIGWTRSTKDWLSMFRDFVPDSIYEDYMNPSIKIASCNCGILSFPAKHLIRERWDDCNYLVDASRALVDVEIALSLWHHMGNPLYRLSDIVHVEMGFHDPTQYVETIKTFQEKDAFLFHYANSLISQYWKRGILGL